MATGREKFLRVAEAKPADAGRGIVRIDPEVMKILEFKEGDVVLILGAKATAAGVRRGYPEDANRGVIRMDGMQRDRKSTRLNSSHITISYAVFCLKKKNTITRKQEHNDGSNNADKEHD